MARQIASARKPRRALIGTKRTAAQTGGGRFVPAWLPRLPAERHKRRHRGAHELPAFSKLFI